MKETAKEIGKQLLEILRLILFIPSFFFAGTIVKFPLLLIARVQESMFGLKMDSWGTHLWQTLIFYAVLLKKHKQNTNTKFINLRYPDFL